MICVKVGDPFRLGITSYVQGVHFNYTAGSHTLVVSTENPGPSDIHRFQNGLSMFAVSLEEEALFFLFRFGDSPWQAAHYNWWINPPVMRPDPMDDLRCLNNGLSVNTCLINATNGLIEAMRRVRLSLEFSHCLLRSVVMQSRQTFDPWHYLSVVEKTCTKYHGSNPAIQEALCICMGDLSISDYTSDHRAYTC